LNYFDRANRPAGMWLTPRPTVLLLRLSWPVIAVACSLQVLQSQDLSPRAYAITPIDVNVINVTDSFFTGSILFDGAIPVTGATGTYNVPIFSYYYSLNFFGRAANINASLPYAIGSFQGSIADVENNLYRSGLADTSFRLSVNLKGGPAMPVREFVKWKQDILLGVSLRVVAPTGQYDPAKVINWGANRWGFKPELGYSERFGKWILDSYAGVWFYTTNPQYYSHPHPLPQSVAPLASFEGHLSYDVKPRLWFSLDGNFWFGGTAGVGGIADPATRQTSSRIGGTVAIPFTKHQSVKVSYSNGAYARFGGNYQNVSVSWQYSWIGTPPWRKPQ
jgi:hypothetical protein